MLAAEGSLGVEQRCRWAGGGGGSRGARWPEFRPPGYHRLYLITPQRSFTPLSGSPTNPASERTLSRSAAPNNGPCVPLSVVGGAEGNQQTTSDQRGRDVSKGHKSSEWGGWGQRRTDGRGRGDYSCRLARLGNLYLTCSPGGCRG